ncbi:protein IQ-DOMAIN 1-like isoform X1 [Carex littledalei]|uniref:Protein IQ-DOMAIN 1-like isoform X1 n=1 Tax=Carex littledalei TaxID=544730 RepID=A0A833R9Y3_9POAL|nr:protein IQ-DOMAIN 1-like isoform X1 [Carex littledalei]
MGSGDWLKSLVRKKKSKLKVSDSQKINGIKPKSFKFFKSNSTGSGINIEELAAVRIQTAYRRYKARKTLRCLRGIKRLNRVILNHPVKKQASGAMDYIQSWNRIQTEVRNRRVYMVTEARNKQKKQDNQQKLDAKLHDIEVDWCGGSDSMEVILSRVQQREEASVKRERSMAYAYLHQWRARPGVNLGPFVYGAGKNGWGWSWTDRWIAARPWEPRVAFNSTDPKKKLPKLSSKVGNNAIPAIPQASTSNNTTPNGAKESKPKTSPQQSEEKKGQKEPKTKEIRSNNTSPNDAKQSKIKTMPRQSVEKNGQKDPKTNEVRSLKPKPKSVKVNKE